MVVFENVGVDYLRAATRGATNGTNVTFYLGGADRPITKYPMSCDSASGPEIGLPGGNSAGFE